MTDNIRQEVQLRMKDLIDRLNAASDAYYNGKDEIMTNVAWDAMFDELKALEEETGTILPGSPTNNVGSPVKTEKDTSREPHEYPALSLAKTKSSADIVKWAAGNPVWISWKNDGLTTVATYDNGKLTKLLTRGNGIVGKNITFLAPYIKGLPLNINYPGHFVVRGEAMISYTDFARINTTLPDGEEYSNPRNLASGTLNLDASRANEVAERGVYISVFTPVFFSDYPKPFNGEYEYMRSLPDCEKHFGSRMRILDELGFNTVEREYIQNPEELPAAISRWTEKVKEIDFPVDGLVICYDDWELRQKGSVTGHHETNAGMAFKWADEAVETTLRAIEWQVAAQSIAPVAVFDPVEIAGSTVQRATLHNINYIEEKKLGIGDRITVTKANLIIPMVVDNLTKSGTCVPPDKCPVCGAPTSVFVSDSGTKTLICSNPDCSAKFLKKLVRFVDREGFDISGLSENTLDALIRKGLITDYADLWKLKDYHEAITGMDGFGELSFQNLVRELEDKRYIDPVHFMYALNIPLWGRDATKRACKAIGSKGMFERLAVGSGFTDISGIGEERSSSVISWWQDPSNKEAVKKLLKSVYITEIMPEIGEKKLSGLTFVITGDVHIFKNRNEFKAYVEDNGGKVAGSVSKKTDFLVNNDTESGSSKNHKAKELGIPIISEDEFVSKFGKRS